MREKSKKTVSLLLTTVLSMSMALGLLCVENNIAKAATSTTFNTTQYESFYDFKKVKDYPNGATLVFEEDVAVNTSLHGEDILIESPLAFMIGTEGTMVEEGYDVEIWYHGQTNGGIPVITKLPDQTICSASLKMKVPEGYNAQSAKYYDENNDTWKAVSSYTEDSFTYPIEGKIVYFEEHGFVYQPRNSWAVELKKAKTDISTLKAQATIPQVTYKYTGSPIEPEVTIPGLTKDKDYKVEYAKNTDVGTATITIKGIYNCYGSFTIEFTIEDTNKEADKDTYKDTKYTDEKGGAEYILNTDADGNITATYTGTSKKKAKKITVPSSITLPDGKEAKITEIGPNAFKGSKATQITIPSTVTKISAKAFAGSEAKKIIIKTDKKGNISIGKGAFKKMKAKNVQIIIKGCKGKAKEKLVKKIQKQAPKGTKVK
ncbi:leucine-rich repeat protein [Butyrivibrio sp. AD3002]|uniref:leucine-rich repeat protein n=1 Tax=Butyrivibrio sp. AD3002 TaxID=1280670 RepID=UPI0003B31722|nr:leucine-rich repeat protein [Butyrivibrio sp. AD3002]